jgi:hypothetical protein
MCKQPQKLCSTSALNSHHVADCKIRTKALTYQTCSLRPTPSFRPTLARGDASSRPSPVKRGASRDPEFKEMMATSSDCPHNRSEKDGLRERKSIRVVFLSDSAVWAGSVSSTILAVASRYPFQQTLFSLSLDS